MAQPPQKKPEVKKEPEMEVKMPGSPPESEASAQPEEHLPEATRAEQEAGKKAQTEAAERLGAEQEAGRKIVADNEGAAPRRLEPAAPATGSKPNPLHGHSGE